MNGIWAVLALICAFFLLGCLGGGCYEEQPYFETQYYNETVPLVECANTTHAFNTTDYSCTNYTTNEPYTDKACEEKQVKYTQYSLFSSKVCDATYTPDVNWDPVCIRSHFECSFRVSDADSFGGTWTFGMNVSFSNGSKADLGDITRALSRGESTVFNWSVGLSSYEQNATCIPRIVSVPNKTECTDVIRNKTVNKQDCVPYTRSENLTTLDCATLPGKYRTVEKTTEIQKFRNVSKPC